MSLSHVASLEVNCNCAKVWLRRLTAGGFNMWLAGKVTVSPTSCERIEVFELSPTLPTTQNLDSDFLILLGDLSVQELQIHVEVSAAFCYEILNFLFQLVCTGRWHSCCKKMVFWYLVTRSHNFNLFNSRKKQYVIPSALICVVAQVFYTLPGHNWRIVKCSSISTEKNQGECLFVCLKNNVC